MNLAQIDLEMNTAGRGTVHVNGVEVPIKRITIEAAVGELTKVELVLPPKRLAARLVDVELLVRYEDLPPELPHETGAP
jgi:hypothetical protein